MKKRMISGIGLVCLILAVAATDAVATDVQIDNGNILQGFQIQSIVIDNNTIRITSTTSTTDPWNIAQAPPETGDPQVALFANEQFDVVIPLTDPATTVNIRWVVSNAESCTPSGGANGWNTTDINGDLVGGSSAGSVDIPVDFDVATDFILTCSAAGKPDGQAGVTVTGGIPPIPDPTVILTSNVSEVIANTDTPVTLSWNVDNAASCDTLLGNAQWRDSTFVTPVDGSTNSSAGLTVNINSDTEFQLSCTGLGNTPVTVVASVTIVIASEACPSNWVAPLAQDLTVVQRQNLEVTWQDIWARDWPFPQFSDRRVGISPGRYMAIEFNSGSNSGLIGGVETIPDTETEGSRYGAISRCPGDFSQHLPDDKLTACTQSWNVGGVLNWTTKSTAASYECKLEPNTTYYLNLTFTDGENVETDECVGVFGNCVTKLEIWHF